MNDKFEDFDFVSLCILELMLLKTFSFFLNNLVCVSCPFVSWLLLEDVLFCVVFFSFQSHTLVKIEK